VAVLCFLVGILGGALVLLWLQRQPQLPPRDADNGTPQGRLAPPAPALPGDNSTRGITEGSAADSTEASTEGSAADGERRNEPADASSEPATDFTTGNATGAATATATATVERLYAALNARDTEAARRLFTAAAADQFDPAFFNQFSRVAVTQLRPTATNGSQVVLEGLVTFTYPDGTRQIETRSFRVDIATDPAQIVASGFGQVIQAR
jgi:serine/threonine-protein kinase